MGEYVSVDRGIGGLWPRVTTCDRMRRRGEEERKGKLNTHGLKACAMETRWPCPPEFWVEAYLPAGPAVRGMRHDRSSRKHSAHGVTIEDERNGVSGRIRPWLMAACVKLAIRVGRMRSVQTARNLRIAHSISGLPSTRADGSSQPTRTELVSLSDSALYGPPEHGWGMRRRLGHGYVSATTVRGTVK